MRVEKGNQSNHTSFIVPAELGSTVCPSLREYVARWMLQHRRYVCCDQVAHSFGISRRQASNIIYSIHRRHAQRYRCSIKRIKEGKGNVVKTWLRLEQILEKTDHVTPLIPACCPVSAPVDNTRELGALFLRRSVGERLSLSGMAK